MVETVPTVKHRSSEAHIQCKLISTTSLLLQEEVIMKLLTNGTECPVEIIQRHLWHPQLEGCLAAFWGRKHPDSSNAQSLHGQPLTCTREDPWLHLICIVFIIIF